MSDTANSTASPTPVRVGKFTFTVQQGVMMQPGSHRRASAVGGLPPGNAARYAAIASGGSFTTTEAASLVPSLAVGGTQVDDRSLAEVLADTIAARWAGRRSCGSLSSQARLALDTLSLACRPDLLGQPVMDRLGAVRRFEVTDAHIAALPPFWRSRGIKPGLINRRLVCMSAMGFNVAGNYQQTKKDLKWWLKPEQRATLAAKLGATDPLFVDYMDWACATGMRVEETLRLTREDLTEFTMVHPKTGQPTTLLAMTVPGLKTNDAQATLPLPSAAAEIVRRRFGPDAQPDDRLFPVSYFQISDRWRRYRYIIGVQHIEGATLKAFRRVSARNLHAIDGMPLDLVRQYLRHENIRTTMGYLRLTGGYNTEEFARWL